MLHNMKYFFHKFRYSTHQLRFGVVGAIVFTIYQDLVHMNHRFTAIIQDNLH